MTTITFTAANASAFGPLPSFSAKSFFDRRAALPDLAPEGTVAARAVEIVSRAAMAAVPFAILGFMFIAR